MRTPPNSAFPKSSITGPVYSVTLTSARNGNQLYCVVTDKYGQTARSNTVKMTVAAQAPAFTAQPVNYTGAVGSTASVTAAASG